ncbi:MAG: hypothetical protein EOP53_00245 [Sphingobacteriales bacterium]|nr:MAG: hypothetical protein EOP53_00245 [Sphingobacteriales bacterium]
MKKYKIVLSLFALVLFGHIGQALAKENVGQKVKKTSDAPQKHKRAAGCDPASAAVDLEINNVRARILNGGDMWWDLVSSPKYEIPKVTEANQIRRHSLFAGALWIGGYDNDNLKLAAMTYRQTGSDFFPGPLDTATATIESNDCRSWDKIYEVTRAEIDLFKKDRTQMSSAIRDWPAHGLAGYDPNSVHSKFLAPFVDVNKDFRYDPQDGDYPDVFGDQTLWYIYNDKGNIHGETQAEAIGLELQTQAFAFATNDEVNNMTFYRTTITNRSKSTIDSTFFGQWVDADLGYAFDDYVMVDTTRDLGICYNGDDNDEGVFGYGSNPPSIGVDFFQGPLADPKDKKDNNRNNVIDEEGETIGMSKFVYYNNDFTNIGNPQEAIHFYRYLTGHWKNGDPIVGGCNGWICPGASPVNYMFPGDPRQSSQWSEVTAGNKPGDRRFLQSAGPFSLKPGAKNNVTVGVVWAKATTGGPTGSLDLLRLADDKAQRLYNNNFEIIAGPDAPQVDVRELDRKVILAFEETNRKEVEKYKDTVISTTGKKVVYTFQGYQVFQLKNSRASATDIGNFDLVRPIAQVDVKDKYTKLVNEVFNPETNQNVLQVRVSGENAGIRHTFEITEDAFAPGDKRLVNYKFYYYLVLAYAVADDPTEPEQYLSGRKTIDASVLKTYTAIPHKNIAEFGGSKLNSDYGDGPELTRIEGLGNGSNVLDLTVASENEILAKSHIDNPTYVGGRGPVSVRIYDPTKVAAGKYELRFENTDIKANPANGTSLGSPQDKKPNNTRWVLKNLVTLEEVKSDTSIGYGNEQLIYVTKKVPGGNEIRESWGFSIIVNQTNGPGLPWIDEKNGFQEATMKFANERNQWLTGIPDIDHISTLQAGVPTPGNWIRSGKYGNFASYDQVVDDYTIDTGIAPSNAKAFIDQAQVYEGGLLGGIIAPAALVARSTTGSNSSLTLGPIPNTISISQIRLANTPNVDLVFTSDKNKWSECVVIEMGEAAGINEGGFAKFKIRDHAGWDKQTDAEGNPVYSTDPNKRGKSWFPGYAINLETGDRLNIMFGEDSHLPSENGSDMLWNPTSAELNTAAGFLDYSSRYLWGGKHWIYIMNSVPTASLTIKTAYDNCNQYYEILKQTFTDATKPSNLDQQKIWAGTAWVMEPLLAKDSRLLSAKDGIIPSDVRIRLRVSKPYTTYNPTGDVANNKNNNLPYYTFSTDNVAVERGTADLGKEAMEQVGVVPNPYYSVSAYENSQLDNRVRLINLPTKCEITIYTIDGAVVRKFTKDESLNNAYMGDGKYPTTFLDWDLKNQKGIPVASGVYMIHINGFEKGEKVLKWFGIMKPIDLDSF